MPDLFFTLPIEPPRTTHQQHKVAVIAGKPRMYEPARLKAARALLMQALLPFKPESPMEGPVSLSSWWFYPTAEKRKQATYKITKPDTDNMVKLLKDCMTAVGFWQDDAQVVTERTTKAWAAEGCIKISISQVTDGKVDYLV